ncbi:MAG: endo-1,4-beta-xylanase [Treponema sp.]|nr:endo-1,4-beta-xylanase [Treponema sp.]MCL2251074.1 endo-1,4-beta-xylanase [Treponema sp.]MCL2251657.1 endo-1,4-beta-xylanase [Treponema sp.]
MINNESEKTNNDPYFRNDPGEGLQRITSYTFDIENDFQNWKPWRTNDGRVLPDTNSTFISIDNPFGNGKLILLNIYFDPGFSKRYFGGFGFRAPINSSIPVDSHTYIEFDFYYSKKAINKYMRFEIWSTSTGGEGTQANSGSHGTNRSQIYIRNANLLGIQNYNIDYRCGFYNEETWFKNTLSTAIPVTSGNWEYLNIDLHTETDTIVYDGILMLGDIRITKADPNGIAIPDAVNTKKYFEVAPIKSKYNKETGFLIGSDGEESVSPDSIGGYHYDIFVSRVNLKPEIHQTPPQWLIKEFSDFTFDKELSEWKIPTDYYLKIRDSSHHNKLHGHCLAWINQSPLWMNQIIPENVNSIQWNQDGLFYSGGYKITKPLIKVKKEIARRIYFDHIMYVMRHFMSTDARYNSSEQRGIIPFHSFDVVNSEVHESRHNFLIQKNEYEWITSLKNVSWLMAMSDNDINNTYQHYMYLLFKYAHIAVPNAQMAENYKKNYNDPEIIPEYMKLDNHDKNGSIDSYINSKPPLLVYNDYELVTSSKSQTICNMIKELNIAWRIDPLYDGRNLIECLGIQGHGTINPFLATNNMKAISKLAKLIDDGFLDSICYSELDLKFPDYVPGGRAFAPDVMNQKQADVLGYQYALLFKLFDKYKKYIDHVIIWNQYGAGWQNSYVLFDHEQMASQAYYAIMDPDKFIQGHSYLDDYFTGEYEIINSIK